MKGQRGCHEIVDKFLDTGLLPLLAVSSCLLWLVAWQVASAAASRLMGGEAVWVLAQVAAHRGGLMAGSGGIQGGNGSVSGMGGGSMFSINGTVALARMRSVLGASVAIECSWRWWRRRFAAQRRIGAV